MTKSVKLNKLSIRLLSVVAAFALTAACGAEGTSLIGTAEAAEGIKIAAPVTAIAEPKG